MALPRVLLLALCALLAAAFVACGSDEEKASAESDASELLRLAVTSGEKVTSATLDAKLSLVAQGVPESEGRIDASIKGPIATRAEHELPLLDLKASLSGAGLSVDGGATATEDKGFLSLRGTSYEVPADVYKEFQEGWKQAREKASQEAKGEVTFESLGIDPRKWIKDPKNAGESKVGDDETIKITGAVDPDAFLDQLQTILERVQEIAPTSGGSTARQLTEKERDAFVKAIKRFNAEIHVGREDNTIRRVVFDLSVTSEAAAKAAGSQASSADVKLDVALLDLNEEQEIKAPSGAKPFSELQSQLEQLGALSGALGSSASGSSGSGSSGSGSSGGISNETLEKYSECIRDAGSDTAAAQKCADLLTP